MSRHRSTIAKDLSPRLVRLIDAARHIGHAADGADISGVASALEGFGTLARWVAPLHGVFVPNNNDVVLAIERIAKQHLALTEARRAFRDAINTVESLEQRNDIEEAQNLLQSVSDEAYFYAGLALGLTLVDFL